jgi:broad specificity phosphatase PhoE
MATVFYESHGRSVDNEAGIASGQRDAALSAAGRRQAQEMGERHAERLILAVFCSDLRRAAETAVIAFAGRGLPIVQDPRLREVDLGEFTGQPRAVVRAEMLRRVDAPFPGGESMRQAAHRIRQFLRDVIRPCPLTAEARQRIEHQE